MLLSESIRNLTTFLGQSETISASSQTHWSPRAGFRGCAGYPNSGLRTEILTSSLSHPVNNLEKDFESKVISSATFV